MEKVQSVIAFLEGRLSQRGLVKLLKLVSCRQVCWKTAKLSLSLTHPAVSLIQNLNCWEKKLKNAFIWLETRSIQNLFIVLFRSIHFSLYCVVAGFLDTESELLREEFKKCLNLAGNRIHAILYVVNVRHCLSKEKYRDTVQKLQTIFGKNIINYIILVFASMYDVPEYEKLYEYQYRKAVEQANLSLCEGSRSVHLSHDEKGRFLVGKVLSQVKTVISHNGGKPFMSQKFEIPLQTSTAWRLRDNIAEPQAATSTVDEGGKGYLKEEILEQIDKYIEQWMTHINNEVEWTMSDITTRLEQLVEAQATTTNAEEISEVIRQLNKSNQEQMTRRIDTVEARLRDRTTRLEQQLEAATLKADERAEKYLKEETSELIQRISKSYEEHMTQRLEVVEQRVLNTTTRVEQLAEAHAAQMKVNEIAQQQMTQRINEEDFKMSLSPLYAILKENKLTGPNYIDWKRNLDIVLTADEYKFCTYEECPPKAGESDSDEVKYYYKKWKKADKMTRCYILASMSGVLQHQHQEMKSASDMLHNLNELFGSQNRGGRQVAMKKLMNTTMTEGTPVRDHVLKMMTHLNELEIRGAQIDGKTQIDIILMSLPESFTQFCLDYNMNKRFYGIPELLTELETAEGLFHQNAHVHVAEKCTSSKPKGDKKKKKAKS